MRFDVVGDPGNPMVLMLPGSFCTGATLRPVADRLSEGYCVVLVTLDGHVRGGSDYLSKEDATDKVVGWLRDRGVGHLAMTHGTSMGAINALDIAREGSIASDVWFFDFPKPVELAVRAVLRRMVRVARRDGAAGATGDALDAMLERGMLGRFLGDGAPVYREVARDCMEVCSFVPDASVAHESATFCECRLPGLPPDVVRRRVFLWGSGESARTSRGRVLRRYPGAEFMDAPGHKHCGYQCARPDEYAALLDEKIRGSR
ncbi:alpha/beta fold hydrolase [Olsenella sp. Marseille-P4559]|uniref:alpha/beta fold hydrolase n=1 Tax=Olsenella sp. Marseille-P4559 TaxID=2364795 RepID=UPI00102F6A11|nr:alpha/beta hydrolase [Olsenella sp. Marseille-P4559]